MDENGEGREPRRRYSGRSSGWIGGVILIVLGLIFLAQNLTGMQLGGNWWALFILIPAIGSLVTAWRLYTAGGMSQAVRAPLIGGLVLLLVTFIFLFNLDWGTVWPLFLVIIGVGALLTGLL